MSEPAENRPATEPGDERRCPHCDSVLAPESTRCLMCGASVPAEEPDTIVGDSPGEQPVPFRETPVEETGDFPEDTQPEAETPEEETDLDGESSAGEASASETVAPRGGMTTSERVTSLASEGGSHAEDRPAGDEAPSGPAVPESAGALEGAHVFVHEGAAGSGQDIAPVPDSPSANRRALAVPVMTGVVVLLTAIIGYLVVQYGGPVELALIPTATHIPPTPSFTPTVTLAPTDTPQPTPTPSITPQPSPTETPQPPRTHEVDSGETLFGLALTYNVSMESIASLNGFSMETPIQSGQSLQIPWPTATPPLEAIALDINGETVIADPSNCERYEIQEGDAISVIAARYNINFELLEQVNRLTDQSVLQPGDTICIPEINYGGILPPTPGPSPTVTPTSFPAGPRLLYPTDGTVVESVEQAVVLQWVAVKDLAPEEWYMVELTDVSEVGVHPRRGFTRQNAFRVPTSWRPEEEVYHDFQWKVSIVRVTGRRDDGGFIYTFGGRASDAGFFTWLGAIPTPTPTPTYTPTATPAPGG